MSQTTAFASLCVIHLSSPSRLLPSSCCPDKDLVIVISKMGGTDRMSMWNSTQGTKIWDVDIGEGNDNVNTRVAGLAWSPDGQSVAIAHNPARISIHSLQDGHLQLSLSVTATSFSPKRDNAITGIWWFRDEKSIVSSAIPDIFRRGSVVTGSAHSFLQILPLLDSLQEDSEKLTATDLFAFQGSQTRSTAKSVLPDIINEWPSFSPDPYTASINAHAPSVSKSSNAGGIVLDDVDTANVNSILCVADNSGRVHCFLDGSFPLGAISLNSPETAMVSMLKHPKKFKFFAHRSLTKQDVSSTELFPLSIEIRLLDQQSARDLARLSSSARELLWYTMRAVKEMRVAWFGSESTSGARELGPKWVRALETKQREQFGQEEPNPILDLTCLLATGRASESLIDFLGSGEQMSERGIQKWESTVSEALMKLRDFSEKRVGPACQRLHLVLDELQGWAHLPQYNLFQLSVDEIIQCLHLTRRAIIISSWLAAVVRRELSRFREFISWLRFETSTANPPTDSTPIARHDILEVNNYFMSGLVVSSIDKWFLGPAPQFQPRDLGIPGEGELNLSKTLERARGVALDPQQLTWKSNVTQKDLSHLDRNLDALIQELAIRSQRVFNRAAGAPCRSAIVSFGHELNVPQVPNAKPPSKSEFGTPMRERIIMNERCELLQHLAARLPVEGQNLLFLVRQRFKSEASLLPFEVGVVLLECCLPEEEQESQLDLDLLEVEFFDDECVVIVYRLRSTNKSTFIATVGYNDIEYQDIGVSGYVRPPAREDLMQNALESWAEGKMQAVVVPIRRRRRLSGFETGQVSIAVNGRMGRRVGCVVDRTGTVMESIDLEGEVEDMEVADDGRAV